MDCLYHLESARASSRYEQLQLSADVDNPRQEWLDARYKLALLQQLKSASRPLNPKEQQEIDVLESDEENLARNQFMTHVSLTKEHEDLTDIDDVEYIPGNASVIYAALSTEGVTAIALCWHWMQETVFLENANLQRIGSTIALYLATMRDGKGTADPISSLDILFYLSEFLIAPFEEFVELSGHIILVPSGPLAQFPLGTLVIKGKPPDHPESRPSSTRPAIPHSPVNASSKAQIIRGEQRPRGCQTLKRPRRGIWWRTCATIRWHRSSFRIYISQGVN